MLHARCCLQYPSAAIVTNFAMDFERESFAEAAASTFLNP
jgi:hypothetical protein